MVFIILFWVSLTIIPLVANAPDLTPADCVMTHEFHVSKCQITYRDDEQALQVLLHIYIDDLELALQSLGAENLFLCTEKESPNAETYVQRYFDQTLGIEVNGTRVNWNYLGKEMAEDLAGSWFYLEVPRVAGIKTIQISNQILLDQFDDQKNIVQVVMPDGRQGYFMFDKSKSIETLSF